ncbi:MAG: hypothetical protein WAK12_08485 [Acidimicrobiales bacterium]
MTRSDVGDVSGADVEVASILFPDGVESPARSSPAEPDFFGDLLLDQVVAALTRNREAYDLLPVLYEQVDRIETITFRQEVWRDLDDGALTKCLREFASDMTHVRRRLNLASKTRFLQQRQGWHLDSVERYCSALEKIDQQLQEIQLTSKGLLRFRDSLSLYVSSSVFQRLASEVRDLRARLVKVQYSINIKGPRVRVLKYDGEIDYSAEIEETFHRFQQATAKDYLHTFSDRPDMNHVDSLIADRVALLFPELFRSVREFCDRTQEFLNEVVITFEGEIQFYLSYLDLVEPLKSKGLAFCLPTFEGGHEIFAYETFDLALANKLASVSSTVVCNDFHLRGSERIIVVSGPNQGGKTTFARAFGQIHYLANLGYPVPGIRAQLLPYDHLFRHFGKEEDANFESGKLEDDLRRIRDVLNLATSKSVVIMNEIFSSTTAQDALLLGTRVVEKLLDIGSLCVIVTFIDELTELSPAIVSMTSTVNPENPVERTFKVIRHPADGLAYAAAIADKYGLTYQAMKRRIAT